MTQPYFRALMVLLTLSAAFGAVALAEDAAPASELTAAAIGQECGGVVCGKGTYCCNPTCNLCLPFGMSCTQQACFRDAAVPEPEETLSIGETCGGAVCGKGTYCCNPTCSLCVPFGMSCTQQVCNSTEPALSSQDAALRFPTPCGDNVCAPGTWCCNPSCGTCVAPGDYCTDQICPPNS